jgi:DNA-binding Lrp family transcriptional regulator
MLSEKDKKILDMLKRNCKLTTKEISEKTGFPITTVHNRIKRMEEEGIITGYTAVIDERKIGKKLKAFIQISVTYTTPSGKHVSQEDLAKKIYVLPEVEQCYIMTGSTDILISVVVADVEELNHFVINKLRDMEGVQNTLTGVVMNDISKAVGKNFVSVAI